MSKTQTINQYLLDLLVSSRIAAAEKTKDAKQIALANKYYKDLTESEVTFGKFILDEKTGKYSVKLTAKNRGWSNLNMVFNTGTLPALARKNQQGAAKITALEMVSAPSLIYVQENDSHYLAVEKDSNIFEALKLTGYEFPADSFTPTIFGEPKKDSKAVGQVDIDHPIVAGRFLLYYITPRKGKDAKDTGKDTSSEVKPAGQDDLTMQGETNVSSENTQAKNQVDTSETDQANPASTQTELKTPAQGQQSDNGPTGQSNSADGTADPADVAKENEKTAEENEAGFQDKKDQNKVK